MAPSQQTTVRQRGGRAAAAAATAPGAQQQQQQQQGGDDEPLTLSDRLNFYVAQHAGLVCCVLGIGLLALGYDRGWMHNTHLSLACLGLCLLGLFFHEFRPFNVQQIMEDEQKAKAASEAAR